MICPECGTEFEPNTWNQKYCCDTHENRARCRRYDRKTPRDRGDYFKKWRKKKKALGICQCCGTTKAIEGLTVCEECNNRNLLYRG